MERIVIEVDEAVAKKQRLSSQKPKQKISAQINLTIARELTESKENLIQFLDELRAKMKDRGLTEENLQDILNDV